MEFKCYRATETALSKNPVNLVDISEEKKVVKFDFIESSGGLVKKDLEFGKIESFEFEGKGSSGLYPERGCDGKPVINEGLSKYPVNLVDISNEKKAVKFDFIESSGGLVRKGLGCEKIEALEFVKGKGSSGLYPERGNFASVGEEKTFVDEGLSKEKAVKFDIIESSGGLSKKSLEFEKIESLEFEKGKGSSRLCPDRGILASVGGGKEVFDEGLCDYSRSITDLPSALISEIFNCLDPKELGIVSCVSNSIYKIASEHQVWKEFYCERWGQPISAPFGVEHSDEKSWKDLFVEREYHSKTYLGRFTIDVLYGHKEAVRTVFALASKKLLFTSGYDSVVRMWNLEEGVGISSSREIGGTIRAVYADTKMLICGGTEGFIHGWRAEEGHPNLFDLNGPQNQVTQFRLWEHGGAITCLALDLTRIYSGSWDMTIRVWDRFRLNCINILRHSDWIWSLAPHDTTLASVSGPDLYIWDSKTGNQISVLENAHTGNTYSLARSHTGKLIFTGGEDGSIKMFEFSRKLLRHVATWVPHNGPVHSLSFEFPWLVSASSDGRLSLIDVRKLLKTTRSSAMGNAKRGIEEKSIEPPQRMLHGFGNNLFSVDIGCDRIVCGGEEGVVRIWNFSQALEIEKRVRALRAMRLENRMRRRKHQNELNGKGLCTDQFSVAAKKNPKNGDRGRGWIVKRGVCGKVKS